MSERKDLGFLGNDFQYRLAHYFMEDKKFFRDVNDLIDQNMFTELQIRRFIAGIKGYFQKYDYVPTYSDITIQLKSEVKNDIDAEYIDATIDKIKHISCEGGEFIKEKAYNFFKQQNMVKAINKANEIIISGDIDRYKEIEDLFQKAMYSNNRDEIGTKLRDGMLEVLSEDYRYPIPTGIKAIDDTLEGGLGKGELALVIGGSGFGKTTYGTAITNYAALNGYKTIQIVFEDNEKQIKRKHYSNITNIEARNLSKPENIETVREIISNNSSYDDNIIIKKFNTGEVNPLMIKNYIKKAINTGFKPDMVYIDYFECLIPSKNIRDQWQGEAHMMRQLESIASELEIAVWVSTQGNRDSMDGDLVTLGKAGGAFAKIQISHIVLTISRTPEDINTNVATLAILKNRAGQTSQPIQNTYFNNGTCKINTDSATSFENWGEYSKAETDKTNDLTADLVARAKLKREANNK